MMKINDSVAKTMENWERNKQTVHTACIKFLKRIEEWMTEEFYNRIRTKIKTDIFILK